MTAPLTNGQSLDRAGRSSRGLQFVAPAPDLKPIEHLFKTAAPAVAAMPSAVGAAALRPPAFAIEFGAGHAREVLALLGSDALGVQSPAGESGFVFRGAPPRLTREGARLVERVVLPGMRLPDGRAWAAVGSGLLDRLGDQRAEARLGLPTWLRGWLAGIDWPADEPEPEATPEHAPSCATCRHHDSPSGERRAMPPTNVLGRAGGMVAGWPEVPKKRLVPALSVARPPRPSCGGCRFRVAKAGGGGTCRGGLPSVAVDSLARPTSRAARWLPVRASSWRGSHELAAENQGRAA